MRRHEGGSHVLVFLATGGLTLAPAEPAGAQQQVQVINYCAEVETVTLPALVDADNDLVDDRVEDGILQHFMPPIWQSSGESCPSGAPVTGAPDGLPNLIPCRVY